MQISLRTFVAALLALILVAVAVHQPLRSRVVNFWQETQLRFFPSAKLAYELGSKHFDVEHQRDYDLGLAKKYFETANALDPKLPYVRHQLARIEFLEGDFALALLYIDAEIALSDKPATPSSYYVRGLIEGYMEKYDAAAYDYEAYLKTDPDNWAAINDYAWVLLKDERYRDALNATDWGLRTWPDNPWLLNSKATALFELGQLEEANDAVQKAAQYVANVTESEWSYAYPGNDPLIAKEGVESFKAAILTNMHTISLALEKSR
jgi:tetratricopeptide (TPR) repeat protein